MQHFQPMIPAWEIEYNHFSSLLYSTCPNPFAAQSKLPCNQHRSMRTPCNSAFKQTWVLKWQQPPQGHQYNLAMMVAVLDLKRAYDMVDRKKLLSMCENILPETLVPMISLTLGSILDLTIGNPTPSQSVIRYGVVQDSTLCAILFNIYIYPLAHRLCEALRSGRDRLPGIV